MWKWLVPINVVLGGLDYLYVKLAIISWTEKINDSELSGLSFIAVALCWHLMASAIFYGLFSLSELWDREIKERKQ